MIKVFLCLAVGGVLMMNQASSVDELRTDHTNVKTKKIAIGSTNPVKIQAVKNAIDGEEILLLSCSALSGVRPQPLSDEETRQGAINRAKNCLEKTDASLGIGLEAGVVIQGNQVYLCHWGALIDRNQNTYCTNGPHLLLPSEYRQPLLDGKNLEEMMHHSTGIESLGAKEGAIGIFTQNRLNREQVLTQMVKVLIGQYDYYQSSMITGLFQK